MENAKTYPLWSKFVLVTCIYFLAGRLGLTLAMVHSSASAFWPPTGIALALLLLWGYKLAPAIFIGAFFVNITTTANVPSSLGIATGNTLEALAGAYLVNRFANGKNLFDQSQHVFRFAILAGLISTLISPTIAVFSLVASGLTTIESAYPIWLTWWIGDMVGNLVVAPPILLWSTRPFPVWTDAKKIEFSLLSGSLVMVSFFVFGGLPFYHLFGFICIPLLIWSALRFEPQESTTAKIPLSKL